MQRKSIIEVSITCVLILLLVFTVIKGARRRRQTKPLALKPQAKDLAKDESLRKQLLREKKPAEELKGEYKELFRKIENETKNLDLKRDPFAPVPRAAQELLPADLHLSGIVWDKENPQAIINDIIVGTGERIGQNAIVEIKQDKVILNDGIHYFELKLGQ